MFHGLVVLLQLLWPFLKESFFGKASVKAWAKHNVVTLVWMALMAIMLGAVIELAIVLNQANGDITRYQRVMSLQSQAVNQSKQAVDTITSSYRDLRTELTWMQLHCGLAPPGTVPLPAKPPPLTPSKTKP